MISALLAAALALAAMQSDPNAAVNGARVGWLYSSHARGLTRCELPLLGKDDASANYRVTLHFAELDTTTQPGERVFDVKLQGQTVAPALDVVQAAGGSQRALTREFRRVRVEDNLIVELNPIKGEPILSAIEVERE